MAVQNKSADIVSEAEKIKLLLMDCDGVLTDGRLYFGESGEEIKVFHVRDGQGLALWHAAGFRSGIISGRDAGSIIRERANELGMHYVRVKSRDKAADFEEIVADADVSAGEVAFIGDDVGDIGLMKLVGLPVAVADAEEDVIAHARYVTRRNGGMGAVRELVDILLNAKKR